MQKTPFISRPDTSPLIPTHERWFRMANLYIGRDYVTVSDTRTLSAGELVAWRKRWPNFMPWELDTRDFSLRMATRALDAVQALRDEYGRGLYVTNACRNWMHNEAVGGKRDSDHLTEDSAGNPRDATAFDLAIDGPRMGHALEALAIRHGFNAIGRYPVSRFIHISMRKPKPNGRVYQWGRWGI